MEKYEKDVRGKIYCGPYGRSPDAAAAQISIPKIDQMPNMPSSYQMRDWQQVAHQFDAFVFDFGKTGQYLPVPWWDTTSTNLHTGFGFGSYIGRFGQNSGTAHEGITCMGAVLGATLAGIDKSNQNGYNWVLMEENYFSSTQNLYLNNIGGVTGQSFWYETLPSILFYQLNYLYPNTSSFNSEFITTADRWYDACVAMGGKTSPWTLPNFNYTAFNFSTMQPAYNGVWRENDAPAAIGWVEYIAYIKTGDTKYLTAAKWCMEYLQAQSSNPLYDVLLVYAPYIALRMNAEQGTNYDVTKLINWCFSGNVNNWGVLGGATWGGYGVDGLMASPIYSFEMESLHLAGAVAPMPRYDQRYARAIGKYMLNMANSARLYYSYMHDANHQTSSAWAFAYDPCSCIGYEGLKQERVDYNRAAADYRTSFGTIVAGNYTKTQVRDNVYEVLQESYTTQNSDQLDHTWSIPLTSGYFHQVMVKGHVERPSTDNDTGFDFYWSTSPDGPWNGPIFTISTTSTADEYKWLPVSVASGTLYLRVIDNNRAIRQASLDKLCIDEIWVESKDNTISPYASGDPLSFGWGNTDLGLYGSAYVGILGGIVKTTNVDKILQLDLLKTDYYRSTAYPTYLYYNPYTYSQVVDVNVGLSPVDLYDAVSQGMVKVNVTGITQVSIPPDSAMVLVFAPAGGAVTISGNQKLIKGVIVDYQTNTTFGTCGQVIASPNRLIGDLNGDCTVDMQDMQLLADSWLFAGTEIGVADINDDNQVNFSDFAQLAGNWLESITPSVQLESFDNFAANGWYDGYATGLMVQSIAPDLVYEGTGAMRAKFESRTSTQWSIAPTKSLSPTLDFSGKTLSFWLWTDLVNDSILNQVIIFDTSGKAARFTVPRPSTVGWTKIIAPITSFVPDAGAVDYSHIGTVQLWFSTWDTPGNSLYIDDLRLVSVPF